MPAQRPAQQPKNRARQMPRAPPPNGAPHRPAHRPAPVGPVGNGAAPRPQPRAGINKPHPAPVAPAGNGAVPRPQPRAGVNKPQPAPVHIPSYVPILHAPTFRRLAEVPLLSEEFYDDSGEAALDIVAQQEYRKLSRDITETLHALPPFQDYMKRSAQPMRYAKPKYPL